MSEKERRIAILCLIFSIFILVCGVINVTKGNIGAAIASFGSGFFYFCIFLVLREKGQKGD